MRPLIFLIVISSLILVGCSPQILLDETSKVVDESLPGVDLPDLGPAPELTNTVWLNTSNPLRLADLRGKVVIIEMWTFGCINCKNVIPSLIEWHERYADEGLVIIGNHFPEFNHEANLDNLTKAVDELNIPYPVAQDNSGETWKAYANHYWPTLYLIDKNGHLRYKHIGEGRYLETETAIQALLAEPID